MLWVWGPSDTKQSDHEQILERKGFIQILALDTHGTRLHPIVPSIYRSKLHQSGIYKGKIYKTMYFLPSCNQVKELTLTYFLCSQSHISLMCSEEQASLFIAVKPLNFLSYMTRSGKNSLQHSESICSGAKWGLQVRGISVLQFS